MKKLILLFSALQLWAQGPEMPKPALNLAYNTTQDTIYIDLDIPQNWHITANSTPDEFASPASIEHDFSEKFEALIWPEPEKRPIPELETIAWEFSGLVRVLLPLKAGQKPIDLNNFNLSFEYQSCSNQICLAPQKVLWGPKNTHPPKAEFKLKTTEA